VIVIYSITFAGEYFYPEPDPRWRFEKAPYTKFLYPGRWVDWDNTPLWSLKSPYFGTSRHMTNVFNVFVILQLFNLICTRKIYDEKNNFEGVTSNYIFIGIFIFIGGF
jgi:hypothetical protein